MWDIPSGGWTACWKNGQHGSFVGVAICMLFHTDIRTCESRVQTLDEFVSRAGNLNIKSNPASNQVYQPPAALLYRIQQLPRSAESVKSQTAGNDKKVISDRVLSLVSQRPGEISTIPFPLLSSPPSRRHLSGIKMSSFRDGYLHPLCCSSSVPSTEGFLHVRPPAADDSSSWRDRKKTDGWEDCLLAGRPDGG